MKTNHVSILASGDEILTGRLIDTNSAWISKFLQKLGYEVDFISIAGDDSKKLSELLSFVSNHSEIIIITGGLGPTEDDKTRFVLSELMQQKLTLNFVAHNFMYRYYQKLGRDFSSIPASNFVQCMLPAASHFIPNFNGTACGIACIINGSQVIALPGVPHEMKSMLELLVTNFPLILPRVNLPYLTKVMTLFGLSESRLGEMIKPFMSSKEPLVGITAKTGYLQISIMGFSENVVGDCFLKIKSVVFEFLISEEGKTPPEILIDYCREQNWRLGSIESCTGGLIADAFISVAGVSDVFHAGTISYSNEAKKSLADVSIQTLETFGAVSEEVVKEMASGFANKNHLNICLSSSGVAGPGGGTVEKPIGLVCLGAFILGETFTFSVKFGGNRQEIRMRSAMQIIGLCILKIRNSALDKKKNIG